MFLVFFNDAISDFDSTTEEFETTFKSLKYNKTAVKDTISSNINLDTYDEIKDTLFLIFKTFLQQGTSPKIEKSTSLFKSRDTENVTNYRPVLVLSAFSNVFERIMYN